MTIRRTLTAAVLVGVSVLGFVGCSTRLKYDGKIGEDLVLFTERTGVFPRHILTVTETDGRVIEYKDEINSDFKLESIKITKDEKTVTYDIYDEVGKPILKQAQKKFDFYLENIIHKEIEDLK